MEIRGNFGIPFHHTLIHVKCKYRPDNTQRQWQDNQGTEQGSQNFEYIFHWF